jgi:flagellin-specific chaperone FliS
MKKKRHNKKRNTAFLYETLINEMTKAVVSNNKNNVAKISNIMKKYFSEGSILKEEVDLYKVLVDTKGLDGDTAEKMLNEVKRVYLSLDHQDIFVQQSKVISDMNKTLTKNVFSNFVPNYKSLATISQMFSEKTPVKDRVLLEQKVINNLVEKTTTDSNNLQPIDNLVYKTFVEKFNDKYSNHLISEQKELLNKYITSFIDNGVELKIFMNEELGRLKEVISSSFNNDDIKNDVEMIDKTKNVLSLLESFKQKQINDEMLIKVLKIQDLVKEVQSNAS